MATFLMILMLLVAIFLIMVVLEQRGRGGGLAGAFGSGGGSNSAFGTKTGDVFTAVTVILFVVFMLLAITLGLIFGRMDAAMQAPAKETPIQIGEPKPEGPGPRIVLPEPTATGAT